MLSKGGQAVLMIVFIPLFVYILWQTFNDVGIARLVNHWQASMFDGEYSPKLTIVLLCFPALALAMPFGFLFDFFTGRGVFASRSNM
jgi:hypothetical protein